MKNSFDKNHKKLKKKIAQKNKDITLLWNCGVIQRDNANKNKITKYTDTSITAEKLGFSETSAKSIILNSMLKTTNSNKLISIHKNNNHNDWRKPANYEFYVDFETFMPTFDELELVQTDNENIEPDTSQLIYMIGISHLTDKYN